jgi:hypothetical protein
MRAAQVNGCNTHEWAVFSTFVEDRALFVQCVECGASGTVDDPSKNEWKRAFHAPSRPYRWHDESRIRQRGVLPLHVVRAVPCKECDCQNRRRADARYERFPAEIITPGAPLTAQEMAELQELADFVRESDLCSHWFPCFLRSYQIDSGRLFSPATHAITDRIERIHQMTLHCSPAVVSRVLSEFASTLPRQHAEAGRCIADVLPDRDHYWMLHDGERYARHGTAEKYGVLVFDCLERAEQFLLTVGKALPAFRPVKVSPTAFLKEVRRAGAFCLAEGALGVRVCEISKGLNES